jgi:hypothetical protein
MKAFNVFYQRGDSHTFNNEYKKWKETARWKEEVGAKAGAQVGGNRWHLIKVSTWRSKDGWRDLLKEKSVKPGN